LIIGDKIFKGRKNNKLTAKQLELLKFIDKNRTTSMDEFIPDDFSKLTSEEAYRLINKFYPKAFVKFKGSNITLDEVLYLKNLTDDDKTKYFLDYVIQIYDLDKDVNKDEIVFEGLFGHYNMFK
jgi:hypothetical protein